MDVVTRSQWDAMSAANKTRIAREGRIIDDPEPEPDQPSDQEVQRWRDGRPTMTRAYLESMPLMLQAAAVREHSIID